MIKTFKCLNCYKESKVEEMVKDKDGDFVCPNCGNSGFSVEEVEVEEKEESSLSQKLEDARNGNELRDYVIDYVKDHYNSDEDINAFFGDLFTSGCISGMVGSLIYYADTHKFYDEYYYEIEELRLEYEESIGEPLQIQGDLKNWYAWFGFQETARKISDEIELNY